MHYLKISGPNLPSQLWDSAIIPSPNGRGVVLIGGIKNVGNGLHVRSDELLELTGESIDSLTWIKLEQKLIFPRSEHIALPVPDTLFKKLPRYAYEENKQNLLILLYAILKTPFHIFSFASRGCPDLVDKLFGACHLVHSAEIILSGSFMHVSAIPHLC